MSESWTNTATNMYHYSEVVMDTIASQITSLTIVYLTVHSDADQRKHQSSAPLAFVRGIHRDSPHKWPVTRKMVPFDDVIMPLKTCRRFRGVHVAITSKHCSDRYWKIDANLYLSYYDVIMTSKNIETLSASLAFYEGFQNQWIPLAKDK